MVMKKSVYSKRYKRFIEALKQARFSADLTQHQAATLLKKHQSFVSKCESGERRVDIVELLEFCRIYKIKPDQILKTVLDGLES
jgi:transcriptional regulator with XRE-family HTH domain